METTVDADLAVFDARDAHSVPDSEYITKEDWDDTTLGQLRDFYEVCLRPADETEDPSFLDLFAWSLRTSTYAEEELGLQAEYTKDYNSKFYWFWRIAPRLYSANKYPANDKCTFRDTPELIDHVTVGELRAIWTKYDLFRLGHGSALTENLCALVPLAIAATAYVAEQEADPDGLTAEEAAHAYMAAWLLFVARRKSGVFPPGQEQFEN